MSIRDKIIDNVLLLSSTNGLHNISMSKLAKSADISAGSIYNHFNDKEDMIKSIYLIISDELNDLVRSSTDSSLGYREQFLRYWLELYRYYIKYTQRFSYVIQFENSHYFDHDVKDISYNAFSPLIQYFQQGVDNRELIDADPQILLMLFSSNIYVSVKLTVDDKITREKLEQLVSISYRQIQFD